MQAAQKRSFELKSNKYVLTLVMEKDVPFDKLLGDIRDKFIRSAKFFRGGQMAVSFKGRALSFDEERQIVDAITESCQLDITCIIDSSHPQLEEHEGSLIARSIQENAESTAVLIPHSLKAGEKRAFGRTVVVLGDVQPGAEITTDGSIAVLGVAMGTLRAGISGDENAFITAMVLKPSELSLASHRAVSGIRKTSIDHDYAPDPQIAYLEDGHIRMEAVTGGIFEQLTSGKITHEMPKIIVKKDETVLQHSESSSSEN